ncbi:hypothetical protein, partial [Bartonella sp. AC134YNZD]|uniref:hypothetical protein n=1 Tax=Bartonella sp. AC134YNZD TaxID=3243446 RepID=UPI0035D13091
MKNEFINFFDEVKEQSVRFKKKLKALDPLFKEILPFDPQEAVKPRIRHSRRRIREFIFRIRNYQ